MKTAKRVLYLGLVAFLLVSVTNVGKGGKPSKTPPMPNLTLYTTVVHPDDVGDGTTFDGSPPGIVHNSSAPPSRDNDPYVVRWEMTALVDLLRQDPVADPFEPAPLDRSNPDNYFVGVGWVYLEFHCEYDEETNTWWIDRVSFMGGPFDGAWHTTDPVPLAVPVEITGNRPYDLLVDPEYASDIPVFRHKRKSGGPRVGIAGFMDLECVYLRPFDAYAP